MTGWNEALARLRLPPQGPPPLPEAADRSLAIRIVAGFGAVIAGIGAMGVLGLMVGPMLAGLGVLDNETAARIAAVVLGLAAAAGGLAFQRSNRASDTTQLAAAPWCLAGLAAVAGSAYLTLPFATTALVLAGSLIYLRARADGLTLAGCGLMAAGSLGFDLFQLRAFDAAPALLAITMGGGAALLIWPPRPEGARPFAVALLLAGAALALVVDDQPWSTLSTAWGGQGVAALLLAAAALRLRDGDGRAPLPHAAFAIVFVIGLAMPQGIAAGALAMLLGYALVAWPLAAAGAVLIGAALVKAYYDLELTLLVKSGLLAVAGLATLGLWSWLRRRLGAEGI